jgi:SAM-dependent methyltransferase
VRLVITWLDRVIEATDEMAPLDVDPAPMQRLTREVAFDAAAWTPDRAARVMQLFDSMATQWDERRPVNRYEPLHDALARGDVGRGQCLEIGSGTGLATAFLAEHFSAVIGVDFSAEMLRLGRGPRVRADAVRLPIRAQSVDAIVLVNALLFPAEVDRVLSPGGVVVWVNTRGAGTPIHLPPEDVSAALGGWPGVAAAAAAGLWAVLRRP